MRAPTCSRSASCSTRCSPAACRSTARPSPRSPIASSTTSRRRWRASTTTCRRALEGIVLKALEKDAAFRYQSARELYHRSPPSARGPSTGRDDRPRHDSGARPASPRTRSGRSSGPLDVSRSSELRLSCRPRRRSAKRRGDDLLEHHARSPADDWIGSGIAETVTADLKASRGSRSSGGRRSSMRSSI